MLFIFWVICWSPSAVMIFAKSFFLDPEANASEGRRMALITAVGCIWNAATNPFMCFGMLSGVRTAFWELTGIAERQRQRSISGVGSVASEDEGSAEVEIQAVEMKAVKDPVQAENQQAEQQRTSNLEVFNTYKHQNKAGRASMSCRASTLSCASTPAPLPPPPAWKSSPATPPPPVHPPATPPPPPTSAESKSAAQRKD